MEISSIKVDGEKILRKKTLKNDEKSIIIENDKNEIIIKILENSIPKYNSKEEEINKDELKKKNQS